MDYYAHSKEGRPEDQWQTLADHLANAARLAEEKARAFGAGDWGRAAGLLHDLGKGGREFQRRLRGGPRWIIPAPGPKRQWSFSESTRASSWPMPWPAATAACRTG